MSYYLPDNWIDDPTPLGSDPNLQYLSNYFGSSSGSFWPIIVIVIIVFLVWSEYGSQDCRTQSCNNKALEITDDDSLTEIIDKIQYSVRKNHTLVEWRRSMIVAIFVTLLLMLYLSSTQMVHGFVFLIVAIMIFFATYFASAWFQAHWFYFNDVKIEQALRELRDRLYEY